MRNMENFLITNFYLIVPLTLPHYTSHWEKIFDTIIGIFTSLLFSLLLWVLSENLSIPNCHLISKESVFWALILLDDVLVLIGVMNKKILVLKESGEFQGKLLDLH